jgi:hypothetical protein
MTSAARANWIDRARDVSIESVLAQRGHLSKLKGKKSKHGPCPICGGTDRFFVNLHKQTFCCRVCPKPTFKRRGAISLTMWLDGTSFLVAVEALAGPPPDDSKTETEDERRAREQYARERAERIEIERRICEEREALELRAALRVCDRLWGESVPLPPVAIGYLASRRIAIDDVPERGGLRWHGAVPLEIGGTETRAAIVARYVDPISSEPRGLWHRPPTKRIKPRTLGPMNGCVIKLWPDDAIEQSLCIAEGVESALCAARIVHKGALLQPMWCCGCRTNIAAFPILPGIEHLTICADADASEHGQRDARACAQRWAAAGIDCEVLIPDEIGEDFADIASAS